MNRIRFTVLFTSVVLLGHGLLHGEGTRQIQPTAASHGKMQVQPNWSQFAWYDRFGVSAPPEYRLHIHISEIGELIHYGFGDPLTEDDQVRNDVEYRLKDPLGNIVIGPLPLPTAGAGYIPTYAQAAAGPAILVGAGGYPQSTYTPLMTGDYFIEFTFDHTWNNEHKQCKFRYIDITVENNAHVANDGRVWSQSWQFSSDVAGNPGYPFEGKMYVYSNDRIVTRCDFNGMDPLVFSMVCNEFGCTNTGNFFNDRRSVAGYAVMPQYKIFLNDPDLIAYPTGALGQLIPPIIATPDCQGNVIFEIEVTQAGHVEIQLDINPLPGLQPEDTVIFSLVAAGSNQVLWNGTDGNGNTVLYGTTINTTVTYYNGLTNLPLYDVELNPNGFKVDLVRPTGPALRVFWDDILVGGTVNLTGCDYAMTGACHPFNYGNNNTINTWWYAISPQTAPILFTFLDTPGPLGPITGPATICPGTGLHTYWVHKEANSTGYIWNYTGAGTTMIIINDTTVMLDFSTAATPGVLSVMGSNAVCGTGPQTLLPINVPPYPLLTTLPLSKNQCNNLPVNIVLTSNAPGATFSWTCTPSSPAITGYSPGAGIFINHTLANSSNTSQTVTYSITPTAAGCTGPVTNYIVTVYPTAVVTNTPLAKQQCNNQATNIVLTSNVGGTLFSWTCIPSSGNIAGYSPGSGALINQVLSNTGNFPETVTYRITPSTSGCNGTIADYVVTVNPTPSVTNAPLNQTQCSGANTNLILSSNVAGTLFTWTCIPSSPAITGWSNSAAPGTMISQVLLNSAFIPQTVNYNILPQINGCSGNPSFYTVLVNPLPSTTVTMCNDPVTTVNSQPFPLRGGIPLGGTYTGPGVAGNLFAPAVAGPGNHLITYTATNVYGCPASATLTLNVLGAVPVICGNILTDVRDNAQYNTIQVGGQCWMADNLNYGSIINSSIAQRDNCVVEKYCFSNIAATCATRGGFYQWDEMMHYTAAEGSQGICPPGWHLPSEAEWTQLFNFFGPMNNAIAASNLKSTGTTGYDATMIGFSGFNKSWNHGTFATMFWSSTAYGRFKAWAHGMNTPDDGVSTYPGFRSNAFSIRCVQD